MFQADREWHHFIPRRFNGDIEWGTGTVLPNSEIESKRTPHFLPSPHPHRARRELIRISVSSLLRRRCLNSRTVEFLSDQGTSKGIVLQRPQDSRRFYHNRRLLCTRKTFNDRR